jgi:hypothetical protein
MVEVLMNNIPDLWWSPSSGLFHRYPGESFYRRGLSETEQPMHWGAEHQVLPRDAVQLRGAFSDYIRVGETVSTKDHTDTYRLVNGPQAMYLEPVDTGEPHVIQLAEHGWTMKHPVTCRAQLFGCPVHQAALNSEPLGDRLGRFACTVGYDGFLVIGEEVS